MNLFFVNEFNNSVRNNSILFLFEQRAKVKAKKFY